MHILKTIISGPDSCSYLSGQHSAMQYAQIGGMAPGDYDERLHAGWFKFGSFLQKPLCHWCRMCYSMRVPLDEWRPNRTQRKVLRRNAGLEVSVCSPPQFTPERLALHNRYRSFQHALRGWQQGHLSEAGYIQEFVHGPVPMQEISVRENGRLIAVLMADEDTDLFTAVTHYHDPALWQRSIGLFTVLQAFFLGQRMGKKWLYLGYYVPGSPTMGYKKQFLPCELRSWSGKWKRVERTAKSPDGVTPSGLKSTAE